MHSKLPYSSSVTGALCGPLTWSRSVTSFLSLTVSVLLMTTLRSYILLTMNESSGTDPRTRGLDAEFDYCCDGQHNEKSQNNKLCDQEWRLGLRRSQRFQCWHVLEELHDQDENIEILSHHRGDNIDPAPSAGEVQHVTSEDRNSQYQQRDDANRNGRRKPMEGKEKPGNAGRYRARQKD